MRWIALISWVVLTILGGCVGATRPEPKTAESIVREREAPLKLVDAATGTEISLEILLAQMHDKRVVYVGERHGRPDDHAVQYSLLRRLYGEDSSLAIGMEMFQVPFQESLDQWSAGQIDETVLRRETEYEQRWGFDFSMYRPMLEYARSRGLEVIALNTPREVAFAVAKSGVAALPEDVAATLPELDLDDSAHRALFDAEFDASEHDAGGEIDLYYEAQVVWDETMGARVAETLARPEGPTRMIVFAGRVHVKRGLGIPDRGARRGAEPYVVVMPVTEKELKAELKLPADQRSADFFWAVRQ
jgi:uncharacterized iron-regulated protein